MIAFSSRERRVCEDDSVRIDVSGPIAGHRITGQRGNLNESRRRVRSQTLAPLHVCPNRFASTGGDTVDATRASELRVTTVGFQVPQTV